MNSYCHNLVVNVALACQEPEHRRILFPRWKGLEAGATVSDEFRAIWDIAAAGEQRKHLVHRAYVDSDDPKDHGAARHALDYSTGSLSFAETYLAGELRDAYTTEECFLENLAMFLGIVSHHVADMCTPVHVGHKMDYRRAGSRSAAAFHKKFERQMGRLAYRARLTIKKPEVVDLTHEYFWSIAECAYAELFLPLESIYAENDQDGKRTVTSKALSLAVQHTADIWHTVLTRSGMADQEWSESPLE